MGMKGVFDSWRSFSANPATIDEQLLIESRYTDAVASTTNWKKIVDRELLSLIDPDLLKELASSVVQALKRVSEADPSGKNKYLPWFANFLKKWMKRDFDEHSPRLSAKAHDIAMFGDSPWAAAEAARTSRRAIDFSEKLARNLAPFHKYMERGLIKKTLEEFEWPADIESAVYTAKREEERRQAMERMREEARSTTTFLEDNDDYTLLRPESEQSSCYFGQGTKWCISATEAHNHFEEYQGRGAAFYFVTFKHLPQDADNRQLALVYMPDDYDEPSEVFDRPDDEVGTDAIYDAARANLFYKGLKGVSSFRKLKKADPKKYAEDTGDAFYEEKWEELRSSAGGVLDAADVDIEFWREWASKGLGLDLSEMDMSDLADLEGQVQERAVEEASDIVGETSAHHQNNPGGPSAESYENLYKQYDFRHLWAHYDEYDPGNWYWNAGWSIEPDVEEGHIVDPDKFEDAIREVLDDNYIYPSEVEWDRYDESVRVGLDPDYDEQSGLQGFQNFLSRMADIDEKLGEIIDDEKGLMDAYIKHGAVSAPQVRVFADMFELVDLTNFEVEYDNEEVSFAAQLRPRIQIPEWILNTPDPQAVLNDAFTFLERHGHTKKLISDRVIGVVEDNMENLLNAITAQMELPFGGDEEAAEKREEERWQKAAQQLGYGRDDNVNVGVYPRADSAGFRGAHVEEEGGRKFVVPKWYLTIDLLMNNEPEGSRATEEDAQVVMKFAQYLDNRDVFEKIQELLKVTMEKALANIDYSELSDPQYALSVADVQEQQIQETHKLLNPSHKLRPSIYKEKAEALMREVFDEEGVM